jgi:hypothetical protein
MHGNDCDSCDCRHRHPDFVTDFDATVPANADKAIVSAAAADNSSSASSSVVIRNMRKRRLFLSDSGQNGCRKSNVDCGPFSLGEPLLAVGSDDSVRTSCPSAILTLSPLLPVRNCRLRFKGTLWRFEKLSFPLVTNKELLIAGSNSRLSGFAQ